MFFRALLLVIFSSLIYTGCSKSELEREMLKYEQARAKWEAFKTPDYNFLFKKQCAFCISKEVLVVVFSNEIYAAIDPETGEDAYIERENGEEIKLNDYEKYYLIDTLFDYIEYGFTEADVVEVRYNEKYGYPEEMFIDQFINAYDDEFRYFISGLAFTTIKRN